MPSRQDPHGGTACATGRRRVDLVHGDPSARRVDGDEHGRPTARSANGRASRCGRNGHCCGLFHHLAHLDHGPASSPGTDPRCRGWHHVGRRRFCFDRVRRLGPKVAAEVDDPDASASTTVLAARQAPTSATHYFRQMIAFVSELVLPRTTCCRSGATRGSRLAELPGQQVAGSAAMSGSVDERAILAIGESADAPTRNDERGTRRGPTC